MHKEISASQIKDDTIKLLNKFQILNNLTFSEIKQLLTLTGLEYDKPIARLISFFKDETVIREGDFDSWIFWIVKGSFTVMKNDIFVASLEEPGEVFGEMNSVADDCRSASVICAKDGVCVSIDMSVIDSLPDKNVKLKILSGIQQLKSDRLSLTMSKFIEEKQEMKQQQDTIFAENQRLIEKEERLTAWEKELEERERNIKS